MDLSSFLNPPAPAERDAGPFRRQCLIHSLVHSEQRDAQMQHQRTTQNVIEHITQFTIINKNGIHFNYNSTPKIK